MEWGFETLSRTEAVVAFEKVYWSSLLIGQADLWLTVQKYAGTANAIVGEAFMAALIITAITIPLLLFLIFRTARQAGNRAKWLLIILTIVFAMPLWPILIVANGLETQFGLATLLMPALQVVAIGFLFTPKSKRWFAEPDAYMSRGRTFE